MAYVVKPGDTLSAIAKANGTTVAAILDANPKFESNAKYNNGNTIFSGTTVNIPGKTAGNTGGSGAMATDEKTTPETPAETPPETPATPPPATNNLPYTPPATAPIPVTTTSTGNINTTVTPTAPTAEETAAAVKGATTLTDAEMARANAIDVMKARFKQYGLESLATKIQQLAVEGATEATITLQLQETPEYQERFKANAIRLKNNLTVLSPAEYLSLEDGYRQVLRSYGLKQFDTDQYVSQFIANDVSATELSNRVVTAVQRVQNASPEVAKTLREYYNLGSTDLVAYMLDPEKQFPAIERMAAVAEIGAAGKAQGINPGLAFAESLAQKGVTQAEATKGYATIADLLPTAEKLSQIYGGTMEGYGQSSAEQEVFNQMASAQRARQRLAAREVAQFSGSAGTSKTSLTANKSGLI